MRVFIHAVLLLFASQMSFAGQPDNDQSDEKLKAKAQRLAREFIIIDTHIDAPERMTELRREEDLTTDTEGEFDYVKATKGGLNCGFMSIYLPSSYQKTGGARALADSLISMVKGWTLKWPEHFVLATSTADVTSQFKSGRVSLAMGMENGAGIEDKLSNVQYFYDKGIRYITLTHSRDNLICDSSFDTTRTWRGLSPFGRQVVDEMNRVGIMVDISHVSDSAFYQVMRITKAPVIASHSSCRFFTPGLERNMSDDMIRLLAKNNGVMQINFGSFFITDEYRNYAETTRKAINDHLKKIGVSPYDSVGVEYARQYRQEHPIKSPSVSDVADHIDHVVKLVGVNHVGIGSDFDGVGDNLPIGLKNASHYPNLIYELLKRGYNDEDIQKICSGNLLRVWAAVEETAKNLQQK